MKLLESLKMSEKQLEEKLGVVVEERKQLVRMVSDLVGLDVEVRLQLLFFDFFC